MRLPLLRQNDQPAEEGGWLSVGRVWPLLPANRHILRRARAVRRGLFIVVWTAIAVLVQALLIVLPGQSKVHFARFYWSIMCRLIGIRVRVIGAAARRSADGRPVVFVSNHSSWLDIPVLGSLLPACFVSKEDVAHWPVVNLIARLGRTVFVERHRSSLARECDAMRDRLVGGDNLILFPEGTTSDGSRVLPFRSAFLSIAEQPPAEGAAPPLVQPVSVVYDRLSYLPAGRATRPLFAWYGDMDIGSHFWRLAQHRGLRVTVLLHVPLDPRAFPSRKALTQACWKAVADGAATLRQNRPARPIGTSPGGSPGALSGASGTPVLA
jgi:1-acyl-sn-glycerol-3-phosphate acyltransferase